MQHMTFGLLTMGVLLLGTSGCGGTSGGAAAASNGVASETGTDDAVTTSGAGGGAPGRGKGPVDHGRPGVGAGGGATTETATGSSTSTGTGTATDTDTATETSTATDTDTATETGTGTATSTGTDTGVPPPSGCVPGAGKTYDVGEGRPYATLGAVPWASLGPGDTVRIFPKPGGYHEKVIIDTRGADGAPIRVCGVKAGDGSSPILDGAGATTAANAAFGGWAPLQDLGLLTIGRGAQPYGFRPGYIEIEGLVFQGAKADNSFTASTGEVRSYSPFAAGVNISVGDHVVIRDCEIRDNGNGLFANSKNEVEGTLTRDVLIDGNYFHDNGVVGDYSMHDAYTQALGITFQYNRFGPLRPGAIGAALKDRSAGTVVRYNWIEGTVRQLDLVDAQDHAPQALADPRYRETFVYGNVLVSNPGDGTRMVHYGGDTTGFEQNFRKGTLYFYGNTVISRHEQKDVWATSILYASTNDETIDFRDNVVYHVGSSLLWLMSDFGNLHLGRNWITTGWLDGSSKFAGTVTGGANVIVGVDAMLDPQTYHPLPGSPVLGAAGALAPQTAAYPVVSQFDKLPRPPLGPAADLGAFAGD